MGDEGQSPQFELSRGPDRPNRDAYRRDTEPRAKSILTEVEKIVLIFGLTSLVGDGPKDLCEVYTFHKELFLTSGYDSWRLIKVA
jgi:hypothetical protein